PCGVFEITPDIALRIDHGGSARLLITDQVGGVGEAVQIVLFENHSDQLSGIGSQLRLVIPPCPIVRNQFQPVLCLVGRPPRAAAGPLAGFGASYRPTALRNAPSRAGY